MTKPIRVPMTYSPTGERVTWVVRREAGSWWYTDNEGYERYGGVTWLELLDRFNLTADNYNMTHHLS